MKNKSILFFLLGTLLGFSQSSDLIPFVSSSKWGFSDQQGKIAIQPVYDSVSFFNTTSVGLKQMTFAYVYQNQKTGVISPQNKVLLPTTYRFVRNVSNSFFFIATTEQNKSGLLSMNNQVILPFEYDEIDDVINDSYLLKKDKKIGLADANGQILIPVIYDQIVYIDEDETTNKCRWRVSNEKVTQYLYTTIYEDPNDQIMYSIGAIESTKSDAPGYTLEEHSKDFEEKIQIRYERNLFLLKKKNVYGFWDQKQAIGFKPKYKQLDYFFSSYDFKKGTQHYLFIEENGKKGLVDGKGTLLLNAEYDAISKEYRYLRVTRDAKTGVFFLSTNKVVFSDFTTIKTAIALDNEFVVALVTNAENNSYYYVGENGVVFKN